MPLQMGCTGIGRRSRAVRVASRVGLFDQVSEETSSCRAWFPEGSGRIDAR